MAHARPALISAADDVDRVDRSLPSSPLNRIPLDVAHHRQQLFDLSAPVQFDKQAWDTYWPYIDNVWCIHSKNNRAASSTAFATTSTSPPVPIAKFWGGCRLERKWGQQSSTNASGTHAQSTEDNNNTTTTDQGPPPGEQDSNPQPAHPSTSTRNRKRRPLGICTAKFRLTLLSNGTRVLERSPSAHSHTLSHIDAIKRPSGVRALASDPFFAGWEASAVLGFLRDEANYPAGAGGVGLLDAAGGAFLDRREVLNIATAAAAAAAAAAIATVEREGAAVADAARPGSIPESAALEDTRAKYAGVRTCGAKGCNLAFPGGKELAAHRREVHGEARRERRGERFTCPERGCPRKKRCKGFENEGRLRDHQLRMRHWGRGVCHGEDGRKRVLQTVEAGQAGDSSRIDTDADEDMDLDQDITNEDEEQDTEPLNTMPDSSPSNNDNITTTIIPPIRPHPRLPPITPPFQRSLPPLFNAPPPYHQPPLRQPYLAPPLPPLPQQQQPPLPRPYHHQDSSSYQLPPPQPSSNSDHASAPEEQRQEMLARLQELEAEKARVEGEMSRLRRLVFG